MEIRITMKTPEEALRALGYEHRPKAKDFLKWDANGRFHAKVASKQVRIHYDLDVDGNHVASIPMPIHMNRERARIQSYVDKQRNGKTN